MILITIWWFHKLLKDWQEVNKQHRILMWEDLISGSSVSWRLGNGIRLRSQTGLQLWRTYMIARTSIGLGRTLKRISKSLLKRV